MYSCSFKQGEKLISERFISVHTDVPFKLKFSEVFDSLEVITLDKNVVVGGLDDIIWTEESMIVLDKRKTKTIFVFDHSGQIKAKITGSGEGPGQFLYPKNIFYSETTNSIFVWCSGTAKFLEYDLNGVFIQELKFEGVVAIGDFLLQGNQLIFYNLITDLGNEQIVILDENYKINQVIDLSSLIQNDIKVSSLKENFFYPNSDNSGFLFKSVYGNYLLSFINGELEARHVFEYGEKQLSYDQESVYSAGQIHEYLIATNSMTTGNDIIDLKNILFFEFYEGITAKLGAFDKMSSKYFFFEVLENDLDQLFDFSSIPFSANNSKGYLYAVYSPKVVHARLNQLGENKYLDKKRLSELDPENPIIFKYHIKPNLVLN